MSETSENGFPWLDTAPRADMRRAVEALYRVHSLMGAISDLNALLARIGEESRQVAQAEAASVMLYDEASDELFFQVALGESGDQEALKREIRLKTGQGIAGIAAASRTAVNVPDASRDSRIFRDADNAAGFHTRNLLAVPMIERDRLVGVLEVVNKVGADAFSPLDEHVMAMFSSLAATAVVNARLIERQFRTERLAALGQAIAGLTHHIKNILTGLGSSTELIQMALDRNNHEMALRTWPVLKRNVQRMSNFVQDLLAFSKPRTPMRQKTDLAALVREACDSVRDLFNAKDLLLEADTGSGPLVVRVDADGIYRCLLNLIHNAAEAVPEQGGRVRISARVAVDGTVEIEVSDNGSGVPPDLRRQIFDPFFSTKGTRGTGLGLATSAKIAQEHGGGLELAASDSGACFRLFLPGAAGGKVADIQEF